MNILVVEDSLPTRQRIKRIASGILKDVCFIEAENGQEALTLFRENNPDFIITDICMPEYDGLSFVENIRKEDRQINIIVISGYNDFKYAQRAIELGVRCYLLKPIDESELEQIIISIAKDMKKPTLLKEGNTSGMTYKSKPIEFLPLPIALFSDLQEDILLNNKEGMRAKILEIFNASLNFRDCFYLFDGMKSYLKIHLIDNSPEILEVTNPLRILERGIYDTVNFSQFIMALQQNMGDLFELYNGDLFDQSAMEKAMNSAAKYISDNLSRELTMAEVANFVDMSYSYFSRSFKRTFNIGFGKYVMNVRIKRAKQELAYSTKSINEISTLLGFNSPRYFSVVFKEAVGCSPKDYRRSNGRGEKR